MKIKRMKQVTHKMKKCCGRWIAECGVVLVDKTNYCRSWCLSVTCGNCLRCKSK